LYFLFLGIKPFLTKMTGQQKLKTHIRGMVGAALGLWAAFCAEIVARTPEISKFLLSFSENTFWVGTIEGFVFVIIFILLIKKINRKQFERVGLTR
jgi:riboflavin transporter FmnP